MTDREIIIEKLQNISSHEEHFKTLIEICDRNLNSTIEGLKTRDFKTQLNENEITFLFGLWLKNRHKNFESDLEYSVATIEKLMNEFHSTYLNFFPKPGESENFGPEFLKRPEAIEETIFYSGTGAYDYQFIKFIGAKYQNDHFWLTEKKINIKDFENLYIYLKGMLNYKINYKKEKGNDVKLYSFSFNNYIFKKNPGFLKILDLLSFDDATILNQEFNYPGDLNWFKINPIYKTSESYIIPMIYSLSEALYDGPFYWMIDDLNYKNTALKNRGDSAENIVHSMLSKMNIGTIYREIEIKTNRTKTITDIDVCVVNGEKMLLFQIKSKRLTQLSKRGNTRQFEIDFKAAVTDAFEQSKLAEESIISKKFKFVGKQSQLEVDFSEIREVYSVCIVLDSYPAITAHTRLFFAVNSRLPIAMSIFDLEVITTYLKSFDELFDYFKKRTLLSSYIAATGELSVLSHYLKNNLYKLKDSDMLYLDSDFAQYFDHHYYLPLMKSFEQRLPDFVKGINNNDYCFCGSGLKFKRCCK